MKLLINRFLFISLLLGTNFTSIQSQSKSTVNIQGNVYNILSFGARSDNKTVNTKAIQKAIDECFRDGGGTVVIPAGTFLTGSVAIKSHVTLFLTRNSCLLASANISDYSTNPEKLCFISVDGVEDAGISGEGTINGQGGLFEVKDEAPNRPHLLLLNKSRNIHIEGVTLKNSAQWTFRMYGCEHVSVRGVSIYSHTNFNNDGIDIDSKDVVISDCIIDCDDDAICFKTESRRACENVAVTNCIIASNCNFIKFGTASRGGFKNITISNCSIRHASESNHRKWNKMPGVTDTITGISGIALEVVDGGFMDHVAISNITMDGVQTPIFIRLGSRRDPTGYLKNVIISNIIATTHSKIPCLISGIPGFYIENVILKDIIIQCKGEGVIDDIKRPVPEGEKYYPENRMFGSSLPAYGMYVRHARNITIDNIQFILLSHDYRPALWFDDVKEIIIRNLRASKPEGTSPIIMKKESDDVKIVE